MSTAECPVSITDEALKQFLIAAQSNTDPADAVRIGVKGGGCSGFIYNLEFISGNDIDADEDSVYEIGGLKFVVDCFSAEYLEGTTIDYLHTLAQSGFKFISDKVRRTCGCGSSFSG